jgi:hypothetical protein
MLECAFDSILLESLKRVIIKSKLISHDHFTVLSLVCKCGALKIGDYVIGSKRSRHSTSSIVVCPDVADKSKVNLAEIEFFFLCDICVSSPSKHVVSFWFTAVKLYSGHLCNDHSC